jgi:hypothetical protein
MHARQGLPYLAGNVIVTLTIDLDEPITRPIVCAFVPKISLYPLYHRLNRLLQSLTPHACLVLGHAPLLLCCGISTLSLCV